MIHNTRMEEELQPDRIYPSNYTRKENVEVDWFGKLTPRQKEFRSLVFAYVVSSFQWERKQLAKKLYEMIDLWSVVNSPVWVYRGQTVADFKSNHMDAISTSLNPYMAVSFMEQSSIFNPFKDDKRHPRCCLNVIQLEPGIRFINIKQVRGVGLILNEAELLVEGHQTLEHVGSDIATVNGQTITQQFFRYYPKEDTVNHNHISLNIENEKNSLRQRLLGGKRRTLRKRRGSRRKRCI